MRRNRWIIGCALLLVTTASLPGLAAPARVQGRLQMPATVFASANVDACTNNPGPYITLYGELKLGGLTGRITFRNNVKGTHTGYADTSVDVVLIPAGESIRFAKQPSQGGVGGNPWIYVQFLDGAGNAYTEEILLGRCVQGLDTTAVDFQLPADATVDVSGADCRNNPGPFVTLEGEIVLAGVNARIVFRNNEKGTHEYEAPVVVDVTILPAGDSITIPKQPPLGGVGGNPLIYFQFLDGSGAPLGSEVLLGKCVEIGK